MFSAVRRSIIVCVLGEGESTACIIIYSVVVVIHCLQTKYFYDFTCYLTYSP